MSEKALEAKVRAYALEQGCLVYKFVSPGRVGVPDRIIIGPNGRILFLELKDKGKKPTKVQWLEMVRLNEQGCTARWADNLVEAKRKIDIYCL